jgi:hypothetical protein
MNGRARTNTNLLIERYEEEELRIPLHVIEDQEAPLRTVPNDRSLSRTVSHVEGDPGVEQEEKAYKESTFKPRNLEVKGQPLSILCVDDSAYNLFVI